ncbi:tRNA lysidine(34) synthetase TilS [Cellulosilyticum sp. ST5]|uniref:tRNA lysidine(34) synthetase TilS n=1 Tax=unclassified Cellulosilyticum TaxID=2643091 RepID=UPI001680B4FF|nr:tRNA lysidine(34) synthetase TilS [Cellulosilyticum sp. WCF-2]
MAEQIHRKIKRFIEKNQLIEQGNELILGVSGGMDSMMLLHYFYTYKEAYQVSLKVAHVHHGIRESADLDAALVEETCKAYYIPFYRHNCNIKALAKQKKCSEEEIGREERYNFFISLLNPGAKIVTAHNMNDQAETMMMRFFRGTDIKGLGGILPKRGQIIRPLLDVTRKEIESYCKVHQVPFRHDETNFMPIYTRNKIRLECTPYIESAINPSFIKVLGEHSQLYREEEDFLEGYTKSLFELVASQQETAIVLDEKLLKSYHPYMQKRLFFMAIEKLTGSLKDFSSKHLESALALMEGQSGKEVHLPKQVTLRKIYDQLILTKEKLSSLSYAIPLSLGTQEIKEAGLVLSLKLVSKEAIHQKSENLYTKYIDYGRIKNGLQIRTRQPEDYISLGAGTKKLKKLFIDEKISKDVRDSLPLIADGDEIIWVIGSRLNTDYYVTQETTKVLEIQMMNER